jgi:Zn-dependent protease
MDNILSVIAYAAMLLVALLVHEFAHALVADRMGDRSPKNAGRLGLNPRPLVDPFGTLVLPGLLLLPILFGTVYVVPFAYAKPMPLNTWALKGGERRSWGVWLAGPAANVVLAFAFGFAFRVAPSTDLILRFILAGLQVNVFMAAIHVVPIPPFDMSKIIVRVLPQGARDVYARLEQYGALFVLVIFFLFSGPVLAFVRAIANGICTLVAGGECI